MKKLLYILLFFPCLLLAENVDISISLTPLQINQIFSESNKLTKENLIDLIDKENKITECVKTYIKKQSKSYAKMIQNNLYDLIHNFDNMLARLSGKKPIKDNISYEEKISLLANMQCETYYDLKVSK